MVHARREQPRKCAGYISSSIFKPSSSDAGDAEVDIDDTYMQNAINYDDGEDEMQMRPQLRHHNTQKALKLKQMRPRDKYGNQGHGKFNYMF